MESLIKQTRVRFSGAGRDSKEESNRTKESFEGDKKSHKWFQRQLSRRMSHDYDSGDSEIATAIGAAAFAIHALEEARLQHQRNVREGFDTSMSRAKTRKEEQSRPPDAGRVSRRLSGKETREPVETSTRKLPAPLLRGPTRSKSIETKADAWKEAKMAKIQTRYEKMNSGMRAWENEKKKIAQYEMERKKSELEQRGAKNSKHYQNKLARIVRIAEEARAQVEERRKQEESEVKERAKSIRSTGKFPHSCFCC
ncbi:unnamed protein product [Ilex paraguariensis]|uniref:Remorin C-terminal domain-containing protein n=1 Tax=Ilex paraguariensis TaxID=185542 RepID=A0ABC8TAZ9_9AQUA